MTTGAVLDAHICSHMGAQHIWHLLHACTYAERICISGAESAYHLNPGVGSIVVWSALCLLSSLWSLPIDAIILELQYLRCPACRACPAEADMVDQASTARLLRQLHPHS